MIEKGERRRHHRRHRLHLNPDFKRNLIIVGVGAIAVICGLAVAASNVGSQISIDISDPNGSRPASSPMPFALPTPGAPRP